ncbi:hypothetical protein NEOLEDRAFT_1126981 [Neolentinus lepideus HHB14362 ss-1]|uniref:DUF6533 domain-containing protein n=1 Tax=Neolentinus lepideus HHB14362 ss-1 TaxID=1314782 RepID=A0A165VSS2_9AGAM|nr:hypothetical protein NEOLEDRAFT_1126981 [Neolentinus lepideus HHB14362 ss-1]
METGMETLGEVRRELLNITATRYLSGEMQIMLYDHLLTFADEVEYIWKAKWSLPKAFFLVLRYVVPTAMIIHTYQMSGLGNVNLSDAQTLNSSSSCRGWLTTGLYLGVAAISIGNFIVLLRLWVIWERNARLLIFTLTIFIITQISTLAVATYMVVHWISDMLFLSQIHMCGLTHKPPMVWLWAPGLVFEVMVFSLALWNALSRPITVSPAGDSLYRDGLGYFVVIALRVLNLILSVAAHISLMFLGIFFIWAATTVTVSRLVFHFRRLSTVCLVQRMQDEEDPSPQLSRQETRATVDKYLRVLNSVDETVVQTSEEEYELCEGAPAGTSITISEVTISGSSTNLTRKERDA